MPTSIRIRRIEERMRQELSAMLITEINDPRLAGISITDIKIDRELAYADIYVSSYEGHERAKEILQGLQNASGYMRRILSARIQLRTFPNLRFHWDPTPEKADHIESLLATLRNQSTTEQQEVEDDHDG